MTETKGHVPEEQLPRYRALKNVADTYSSLGNMLSGLGHYVAANEAWQFEAAYKRFANELRVTIK